MINRVKKIKKKYIVLFLIFVLELITPFTYSRYTSKYTKHVVISAIQSGYVVEFNSNDGVGLIKTQSFKHGVSQKLLKNEFTKGDYSFLHWNTKADGTGISYEDEQEVINLTTENGGTITLYAIYDYEKYIHDGDITFDGSTSIINTGICLFNEKNINKDFEVSFEIKSRGSNSGYETGDYPTIMSAMDERGNPYPGMVYRIYNNWDDQLVINASETSNDKFDKTYHLPNDKQKVTLKRTNGAIYLSLNDEDEVQLLDISSMKDTFDYPVVFGASLDENKNPQRWFQGTLSNLKVVITEPNTEIGIITYNANGGIGNNLSQHVLPETTYKLMKNTYTNEGYIFAGWNTAADGSGTNYTDEQEVTNLVSSGQRVYLFAQWRKYKYKVKFDINDGTSGSMDLQEFESGITESLTTSAFQKDGYSFAFWNTVPDGSGVSYEDNESVLNLGTKEGQVITLYAIYEQFSYQTNEDIIFDGTNYINTHIYLFSRKNVNKDFEISFEIKDYTNTRKYNTIVSSLDESGNPYPGFVFRINDSDEIENSTNEYNFEVNASISKEVEKFYSLDTKKVVIKRVDGILYLKLDDGEENQIIDYSTLSRSFYYPLTVGASLDREFKEWRNFHGTISNLNITLSQ